MCRWRYILRAKTDAKIVRCKKMQKKFVSIVIPTRNAAKTLHSCLESLQNLNYPKSELEIIITDGMSTDDTTKVATSYDVKVVTNKKISIATGRNLGFAKASGELIAFTDADCIVDKNWISHSIKYFDDPLVAGVSGPIHTPLDQDYFGSSVAFLFSLSVYLAISTHHEKEKQAREVDDFPTCNAIYTADALSKVMPLDENLFSGSDVELNYKLRQAGYKLLSTPDIEVWHYKRSTPRSLFHQMKRYAIGRLQLGKKYTKLIKFVHIAVGLAIPALLFFLASFFISRAFFGIMCALGFLSLFLICGVCLIKTRSIRITGWLPVAMAIMVIGWSCGFCRELIHPIRGPRAN